MKSVINLIDSQVELPIKINISENLKNEIRNFATSDLTRELGGVLIGTFTEESNQYILNVENYIIAKYTDAHLSSVTFTAETWTYISSEMDEKYPDYKILGWYHTHPGFGIFLSNWDIFIQENFFNIPWQIAYVIDPCHKTDGFFIWKDENICKISEDSFNFENDLIDDINKKEIEFENIEENNEDNDNLVKKENIISNLINTKLYKFISNKSKIISLILLIILLFLLLLIGKDFVIKKVKNTIQYKNGISQIIKEYKDLNNK